ncbi:MAG: glycosyltransferase family 4 protein [Campylobacterales bacterium]
MNIAIVFEGSLHVGGGFQQQLTSIAEIQKLKRHNFVAFTFAPENTRELEKLGLNVVTVKSGRFDRIKNFVFRNQIFFPFQYRFKLKNKFEKLLDDNDIDLVYFLSPSELSLNLISHSYIITVWDLCHRDHFEFPEVGHYRVFEWREILYSKSLPKAVAVLVDSDLGKDNVVRRYGVDEERVYVAPFSPSSNVLSPHVVDIKQKYGINGEYIYYPAQFWSHKNHVYILDALKILNDNNVQIYAIFSGSDKGNLKFVLDYAESLGIKHLVKYIGFAPNDEIYSLYKFALSLVMPTYFGPTNIPPLEAFQVGCPVIYSDLKGLREQVGNAALLCDLKNPHSLANHIDLLRQNDEERQKLINKGVEKLNSISKTSLCEELTNIIDGFAVKLKCFRQ